MLPFQVQSNESCDRLNPTTTKRACSTSSVGDHTLGEELDSVEEMVTLQCSTLLILRSNCIDAGSGFTQRRIICI